MFSSARILNSLTDLAMREKITVRGAKEEEKQVIAQVVAMAIADKEALCRYCGEEYLSVLAEVAGHTETQYSWQYSLIAEVGGVVAGAIVGYDGAQLEVLRNRTLSIIQKYTSHTPSIADETEAGEYYLDSLGVFAEFRNKGVARALITALCEKAAAEGHRRIGLIVDYDNTDAQRLYTDLGFNVVGTKLFFGHKMWHLQQELDIREIVLRSTSITTFQRRVYLELLNIPAGTTITYGDLARRIGCGSAQAVGQALKRNPFAPAVPCHRGVAADGSLGGYNGMREGEYVERKRALLEQERAISTHK